MIRFAEEKEALFAPFELGIDASSSKALMVFDDEVWEDLILINSEAKEVRNVYGRTLENYRYLEINGEKILAMQPGTGAPSAAMEMEMLIATGFDKIVAFGTCGRLLTDIPQNEIILPTFAYRDEGTSYHYLADADTIAQSEEKLALMRKVMTENQLTFIEGGAWTTDAVYRETAQKAEFMKSQGCVVVDMELSALLAVAEFRGVSFAEFLIAQDSVYPTKAPVLERHNERILNAAINILWFYEYKNIPAFAEIICDIRSDEHRLQRFMLFDSLNRQVSPSATWRVILFSYD